MTDQDGKPPQDDEAHDEPASRPGGWRKPADYYEPSSEPPVAPKAGGCPRWLPIGCGVAGLVLLLGLIGGFVWLQRGGIYKLADVAFETLDRDLEQMVSIDVTKDQAARFRAELKTFREGVRQGRHSVAQIEPVLSAAQRSISDRRVHADELDELIRLLEAANRTPAGKP